MVLLRFCCSSNAEIQWDFGSLFCSIRVPLKSCCILFYFFFLLLWIEEAARHSVSVLSSVTPDKRQGWIHLLAHTESKLCDSRHTHIHTSTHLCTKGKRSTLLKKCIVSHRTQCWPDNSTFILLWADSGRSQPACLPATKALSLSCHRSGGAEGWLQSRPLLCPCPNPGSDGVPTSRNPCGCPYGWLPRLSVLCWWTTERMQGTDGVSFHSLAQWPFSWVWSPRDNDQAGCLCWVLQRQSAEPHLVGWLLWWYCLLVGLCCVLPSLCLQRCFAQQFMWEKPGEFRPDGQSLRLQDCLVKVGGVKVVSLRGTGLFCLFNSEMVLITEFPQINKLPCH